MHGGANATRVPVCDWDGLSLAQKGIKAAAREAQAGITWDFFGTGLTWSNNQNWSLSSPVVAVAVPAALNATIVQLTDQFWGYSLGVGDWIGFFPFNLGRYEITEVIAPGTYRLDYPLRKALVLGNYATLNPVIAMRIVGENSAQAERGAASLDGLTIQFTEVRDYDVQDYFADASPAAAQLPWILTDGRWNDGGVWDDIQAY